MKNVVDQNYFRAPELRQYLASDRANEAVVTDMALFEMLKGTDPIYSAKRSLAILSEFPDQVHCTAATGELMRRELADEHAILTPLDDGLTKRLRQLLREVAKFNTGASSQFPLDEAHVLSERTTVLQQRLDHVAHKTMLDGLVNVLRGKITTDLQKQMRRGLLTKDVYDFAYQTAFIGFRDAVTGQGATAAAVEQMYLEYALGARLPMVYTIAGIRWFGVGGADAMPADKITNDVHDLDYVIMASYFDGILSKDSRVNSLYQAVVDFFQRNIIT